MSTPTQDLRPQSQATVQKPVGQPAGLLRSLRWPVILLLISIVTTAANGARFMANFQANLPPIVSDADLWPWPWIFEDPMRLLDGLPFTLALLGILISHEMGHYVACRLHKINALWPHVIPAPTLSGTAGAFILIRGRIPNRKALLDVGIYGPLCGFVVCIPVLVLGLMLSQPAGDHSAPAMVIFGEPLAIRLLHEGMLYLHMPVPDFYNIVPHPVLVAGWIGLFITSLNLIPAGQLDGGHILYAISPRLHVISTNICTVLLLVAGILHGGWIGWLLWGCFMMLPAMHHPKVPRDTSHGPGVTVMGLLALVILVLSFIPRPFTLNEGSSPRSALMDYLQK